jgi:hypothetical protein
MMNHGRLSLILGLSLFLVAAGPAPTRPAQPATQATSEPAEPWVKSVAHAPQQPKTGDAVKVTASVAQGFTGVTLQYQLVEPGAYVELKDPEYAKNWTPIAMQKSGEARGRATFAADLPADLQKHRRLIRYRISAKDAAGKPVVAPIVPAVPATATSPAKPELLTNYAYFVYDGLPPWTGAVQPGSRDPERGQPATFTPEALGRVQAYHFIARKESVENTTWREQARDNEYRYTGTLVVDGVVYEHVRYRARGGVWRYAMGKNMWKFDFPDNHRLRGKDDYGQPYEVPWSKLNLRGCIQQGNYGRRGEHGLYEAVSYRMFNLAGVPAPRTHYIQLRIIDEERESPPNQYKGDFWGLYLAIENEDGRFLKSHGLPDGNLYKMLEGGGAELNHQAPPEAGQPADRSDIESFIAAYLRGDRPDEWWRDNLDLPTYYSYRSIVECIHHYDIAQGKNYDYFHNPKTHKWTVIPWDLDLTWGDHMYGSGQEPFAMRVLAHPAFNREYQNRLREIRDLLYNPEQTGQLIDECVEILCDPKDVQHSIVEADRRKWDFHPALAIPSGRAGQGEYYQASPSGDFAGMVQQMKAYIVHRSQWIDRILLNDRQQIPATPTVTYTGPADHAADQLKFESSPYNGKAAFAAIQWRIADVTPVAAPRTPRNYEITAAWESGELVNVDPITIPANAVKPGHTYRVRVRVKDTTNHWSHWSAPVEFTVK